jgi:hypothetical protein
MPPCRWARLAPYKMRRFHMPNRMPQQTTKGAIRADGAVRCDRGPCAMMMVASSGPHQIRSVRRSITGGGKPPNQLQPRFRASINAAWASDDGAGDGATPLGDGAATVDIGKRLRAVRDPGPSPGRPRGDLTSITGVFVDLLAGIHGHPLGRSPNGCTSRQAAQCQSLRRSTA